METGRFSFVELLPFIGNPQVLALPQRFGAMSLLRQLLVFTIRKRRTIKASSGIHQGSDLEGILVRFAVASCALGCIHFCPQSIENSNISPSIFFKPLQRVSFGFPRGKKPSTSMCLPCVPQICKGPTLQGSFCEAPCRCFWWPFLGLTSAPAPGSPRVQ